MGSAGRKEGSGTGWLGSGRWFSRLHPSLNASMMRRFVREIAAWMRKCRASMLDSTVPYCSWVYASAGMETTTNRSRVAKDALISSVALGTSQMFFRNSKYGATESAKSGEANAHQTLC